MKKIISLVILVMMIFMSCAMEPPEDVIISGYTKGTVLYTANIQLSANVPVFWSVDNGNISNGVVTKPDDGCGYVVVTATDYNERTDSITISFGIDEDHDFRLVGEWYIDSTLIFTFTSDGRFSPVGSDGNWSTSNGVLTLASDDGYFNVYEYEINDNIITLTLPDKSTQNFTIN